MYTGFEHLIHLKNFYKVFEKMYTVFENDITVSGTPRSVHTHTHTLRGSENDVTAWGPRGTRGSVPKNAWGCTQPTCISLLLSLPRLSFCWHH